MFYFVPDRKHKKEHTLNLLMRFFRKFGCVVLATGVRVWSDAWMWTRRNDRSRWRSVNSTYPHGKKAWDYLYMYGLYSNKRFCFLSFENSPYQKHQFTTHASLLGKLRPPKIFPYRKHSSIIFRRFDVRHKFLPCVPPLLLSDRSHKAVSICILCLLIGLRLWQFKTLEVGSFVVV